MFFSLFEDSGLADGTHDTDPVRRFLRGIFGNAPIEHRKPGTETFKTGEEDYFNDLVDGKRPDLPNSMSFQDHDEAVHAAMFVREQNGLSVADMDSMLGYCEYSDSRPPSPMPGDDVLRDRYGIKVRG